VASLFRFRSRPNWQKIGVVSFAWPLMPLLFVVPCAVIIGVGLRFEPVISLAVAATLASGAAVYHWRIRGSAIGEP
jgi:hypothetical protein